MKNMVSTIIIFGFIFIIILGGAFLFQKMNGLDTMKNADQRINDDIHRVINDVRPENAGESTASGVAGQVQGDNAAGAPEGGEAGTAESKSGGESAETPVGEDNGTTADKALEAPVDNGAEAPAAGEPEPPADNSTSGDGMIISYPVYMVAENSEGGAFDNFVKEDPFGKSIKNIGRQLKEDSEKIKKDFSGSTDNGSDNKSAEEK